MCRRACRLRPHQPRQAPCWTAPGLSPTCQISSPSSRLCNPLFELYRFFRTWLPRAPAGARPPVLKFHQPGCRTRYSGRLSLPASHHRPQCPAVALLVPTDASPGFRSSRLTSGCSKPAPPPVVPRRPAAQSPAAGERRGQGSPLPHWPLAGSPPGEISGAPAPLLPRSPRPAAPPPAALAADGPAAGPAAATAKQGGQAAAGVPRPSA
ncbi:hypothetical protein V8C86DRAFT_2549762 [Haematococcus lacustris]